MRSIKHAISLYAILVITDKGNIFLQLSRNIFVLQVETHCCVYYHVCDQLVSPQVTVLQVFGILHV